MEIEKLPQEIIDLLNKPLPKEAISQHPTKKFLSTIKAIYVVERLNECFGVGGWFVNNEVVIREKPWVVIKASLTVPKYGIIVPDIFGGNDNIDLGDAYKGACTDALTKIASYLGIGMNVFKGLADKASTPSIFKDTKPTEDERPWLTESAFTAIIQRVKTKDKKEFATIQDFVNKIKDTYKMKNEYKIAIDEELNKV